MMNIITNPILSGFHPDPSICRNGEDYYIATSTFEWFPGVRIFHSKDLKNWQLVSRPLNRISQLDMRGNPDSGGIWAPCLSYCDNKFWLVYTDVKAINTPWKNGRNYLVTADQIEGPWSEPIFMGNGGFDPSLFHDNDGRKYLVYRPWGPKHHSNPHNLTVIQEFFPKEQTLSRERHTLFEGTTLKYTEGAHLYHINEYYYLLVAEGGTSYEHAATLARSKQLLGPYELHPEITILTAWDKPEQPIQKSGHASIIHTHTDEWYLVFLSSRPLTLPDTPLITTSKRGYCPLGRETSIERLEWQNDWLYVVGGKAPKLQIVGPNIKEVAWSDSSTDDDHFDDVELNKNFQTLRIPFSDELGSLTALPSHLRLYGNDSLISLFKQSTVARRWQHFSFEAEVKFAFSPHHFQQTAGLTCYYNTENWTYCQVGYDAKLGRLIRIIQLDNQEASYPLWEEGILIPAHVDYIYFKVIVNKLSYQYHYSFDGQIWHEIPIEFAAWKLSDDYVKGKGFFTGAFVGMHCEDISGDGCFADFDYFKYHPIF